MSIFGISSSSKNGRRRAFIIVSLSPNPTAPLCVSKQKVADGKKEGKNTTEIKIYY
jgi:hypothetical protein